MLMLLLLFFSGKTTAIAIGVSVCDTLTEETSVRLTSVIRRSSTVLLFLAESLSATLSKDWVFSKFVNLNESRGSV